MQFSMAMWQLRSPPSKPSADQTQEERAAMGLRARQVATEKFGHEQLVEQFLTTVLKTARDC
jgi:hypothetical protein